MIIGKSEFTVLCAAKPGEHLWLKVDCGLRQVKAIRHEKTALIDGEFEVDLDEKIKDNFLYLLDKQGLRQIAFFSKDSNRFYKLQPTPDWPTIAISSVPMHRRSSPRQDTLKKIEALKPYGRVLDTCMGPGYTAIESARRAKKIITFEKDPMIYEIDRINPYSQRLFESDNIEVRLADVSQAIVEFSDQFFDCVMHDPPTFTMAPELFSINFYEHLRRVLKTGGRLFHYTPLYKVKQGFDFPAAVAKKLRGAGFKEVRLINQAQGVLCQK